MVIFTEDELLNIANNFRKKLELSINNNKSHSDFDAHDDDDIAVDFKDANIFGHFVPNAISSIIFSEFLSIDDISRFDIAICDKRKRLAYLECIKAESFVVQGNKDRDFKAHLISWMKTRSIKIRQLKCSRITDRIAAKIAHFGSRLQ